MGYDEVLRALSDEVRRQIADLAEAARRDAARIADEAQGERERTRAEALARAAAEREARAARARERARLEEERAVLVEKRRLLEEVAAAVRAELRAATGALVARLVDEVAALASGARRAELIVDPGAEEAARRALERHAALAAVTTVRAATAARGGVELILDGRVVLDDTLEARLEALWPAIEPRVAAALFGDTDSRGGSEGDGDGAL